MTKASGLFLIKVSSLYRSSMLTGPFAGIIGVKNPKSGIRSNSFNSEAT